MNTTDGWMTTDELEQRREKTAKLMGVPYTPLDLSAKITPTTNRHLCVNGTDGSGYFVGDGTQPPFVVYDIDAQEAIAGPFLTRKQGDDSIQAILAGKAPFLDGKALSDWLTKIDTEGQRKMLAEHQIDTKIVAMIDDLSRDARARLIEEAYPISVPSDDTDDSLREQLIAAYSNGDIAGEVIEMAHENDIKEHQNTERPRMP